MNLELAINNNSPYVQVFLLQIVQISSKYYEKTDTSNISTALFFANDTYKACELCQGKWICWSEDAIGWLPRSQFQLTLSQNFLCQTLNISEESWGIFLDLCNCMFVWVWVHAYFCMCISQWLPFQERRARLLSSLSPMHENTITVN